MKTRILCPILFVMLVVGWSTTASAQQTLTNAYSQAVLADKPVAYYQFQESSGATTAVDSSGAGNNGTYNNVSLGNPSATAFLGQAAGFSGSSSSYVAVPALGNAYQLGGSGNDQVTIEAWIKPLQLNGDDSIYTVDQWVSGIVHFLVIGNGTTSMRFTVANNNPDDLNFKSSSAIQVGLWAHLVVTYDDTTGMSILYINGQAVGTNTFSAFGPVAFDAGSIGVQADGGDGAFQGMIDEFAVYTNVLSPTRVQAHYTAAGQIVVSGSVLIINQPQDALAAVGGTANFATSVTVVGTTNSPTYQWQTNGVNITGATGPSYTTPTLTLANNGLTYDCVVSAIGATNATTRAAMLTVVPAPGMSYADSVRADDPVVYYRFEETNGASTAADSSGSGNNGTYTGVTLGYQSATADLGTAAAFSGSSASYVAVPALAGANSLGGSGNNQCTIEAWINPQQIGGANAIYTMNQWNTGIIHVLENGTSVRFTVAAPPYDVNFPSSPAIAAGKWTYMAVVYDAVAATATLYLNGQPAGTYNYTTTTVPVSLDAGSIGIQMDGGDPAFTGLIDEFAVYTNALSIARIQEHFVAAGTVTTSGSILITSQPLDILAAVGGKATFTTAVNVAGTINTPTYQWQTNGVNITGATGPSYTTPTLTLANNGLTYDCVVSAIGATNATTRAAMLTVLPAPGMSYADSVRADDPVVYYRFEETNGASTAADSSGSGNNGTYTGVALGNQSATAWLGNAAAFSGSSASFVAVPALAGANSLGGSGNNQCTIEAWINPQQIGGANAIYTMNQWNTGIIHVLENGTSVRFTVAAPPYDVNFPSSPAIAAGKWTYMAVVYDAVAATATLYLNGQPAGTYNYTTTTVPVSLDAGSIGIQMDGGDPAFTGLIDEFAVYTNALSIARIQEHFVAATAPLPTISIGQSGSLATISWGQAGFILQSTAGLKSNPIWVNVPGATNSPVSVPITNSSMFYRLMAQ
jgi:hypothetical protein